MLALNLVEEQKEKFFLFLIEELKLRQHTIGCVDIDVHSV